MKITKNLPAFKILTAFAVLFLLLSTVARSGYAMQNRLPGDSGRLAVTSSHDDVEDSQTEQDQDGDETELKGTVEAVGTGTITIDGKVITLNDKTELQGTPVVGSQVKVEVTRAADGTLTAKEVKVLEVKTGTTVQDTEKQGENEQEETSVSSSHGDDEDSHETEQHSSGGDHHDDGGDHESEHDGGDD